MKAIIAGTFDPFTLGHLNLTERALGVFGAVTIAVAEDTGKSAAPLKDRVAIAELSTASLTNVEVVPFRGLLSEFLEKSGDCVLVRGVRGCRDYEYEREHLAVYRSLCRKDAVLFVTEPSLEHVSSTVVRELALLGVKDKLRGYVSQSALDSIISVYGISKRSK